MPSAVPVTDVQAVLGEGPRWFGGRLHWVDIVGRRHHALLPSTGEVSSESLPDTVSLVLPRAGGGLVLAVGSAIVLRDDDGSERTLARLSDDPEHRCNDGTCDPQGRLYVGTMRRDGQGREGRLCRIDPDGAVTVVADGVGISNGIAFDAGRRRMYYVDTVTGSVDVWDLDDDGLPNDRRWFADIDGPAVPDGLVLDAGGAVWVALHEGGAVARFDHAGNRIDAIPVPAGQVTAPMFGGDDLTDLYITTAREDFDDERAEQEPLAGRLFVVAGAGRGVPLTPFAG